MVQKGWSIANKFGAKPLIDDIEKWLNCKERAANYINNFLNKLIDKTQKKWPRTNFVIKISKGVFNYLTDSF